MSKTVLIDPSDGIQLYKDAIEKCIQLNSELANYKFEDQCKAASLIISEQTGRELPKTTIYNTIRPKCRAALGDLPRFPVKFGNHLDTLCLFVHGNIFKDQFETGNKLVSIENAGLFNYEKLAELYTRKLELDNFPEHIKKALNHLLLCFPAIGKEHLNGPGMNVLSKSLKELCLNLENIKNSYLTWSHESAEEIQSYFSIEFAKESNIGISTPKYFKHWENEEISNSILDMNCLMIRDGGFVIIRIFIFLESIESVKSNVGIMKILNKHAEKGVHVFCISNEDILRQNPNFSVDSFDFTIFDGTGVQEISFGMKTIATVHLNDVAKRYKQKLFNNLLIPNVDIYQIEKESNSLYHIEAGILKDKINELFSIESRF